MSRSCNTAGYFTDDPLEFVVGLQANSPVDRVAVGIEIVSLFGETITTFYSTNSDGPSPYASGGPGRLDFQCHVDGGYLRPGVYTAKIKIESDRGGFTADPAFSFEILQKDTGHKVRGSLKEGLVQLPNDWSMPEQG